MEKSIYNPSLNVLLYISLCGHAVPLNILIYEPQRIYDEKERHYYEHAIS